MAETDPNKTFHVKGVRENEAAILFYAIPFFPEITLQNDTVNVTFNQGYIFDHANMKTDDFDGKTSDNVSIPRIEVTNLEHTHTESATAKYSLEIQRNRKSGEVIKAQIVNSDAKSQGDNTFRNFIVENEIASANQETLPTSAGSNGENSYVYMDLADFEGFELKELYVRENIHVYYRGFEQLYNQDADGVGSDEPFPLLQATGFNTDDFTQNTSTGANGMIGIKAIVREERDSQTNILQIREDNDQIYFFVPDHTDGSDPAAH